MLNLIKTFKNNVKIKSDSLCIDNWVFKLHYRVTTVIFLVSTVLVTSKEYIGESMKCLTSKLADRTYQKFLESFCFYKSTFTVVSDDDFDSNNVYNSYGLGMPGPRLIRKHMYYQWVPYVLFLQAIMFYATHYLWKIVEGGEVRKLMSLEKNLQHGVTVQEKKGYSVHRLKATVLVHIRLNQSWAWWFIFFEVLNLANAAFQIYLTNLFLDKQFFDLGVKFGNQGPTILEKIFPKVSQVHFLPVWSFWYHRNYRCSVYPSAECHQRKNLPLLVVLVLGTICSFCFYLGLAIGDHAAIF
ncbi:innexin inx7-like isoform X2 [Zophobas morio]|uniref:innexin inx7-like isoform X2 n=1 Tax=Zophobas morio TaxID=2755281 RepID=UPI003083D931